MPNQLQTNFLISILTVVYNNSKGLERTIQSVSNQTYSNIEYVIIDGASTDGTLNIIERYKLFIDYYLSEEDEGIYDAMNKGVNYCNGDFVIFLNAGDCFYSSNSLDEAITKMNDPNLIYFGRAKIEKDKINWLYPPTIIDTQEKAKKWAIKYLPNHQTILFPKCFYKFNKFNTTFKLFGDTDYKIRCLKYNDVYFLDIVLSTFELGGVSSRSNNWSTVVTQFRESFLIGKLHYKNKPIYKLILYIKTVRFIIKFIARKLLGSNYYYVYLKIFNKLRAKLPTF